MLSYIIVLTPIALIMVCVGLYKLVTTVYHALYDAVAYLKERKELKWM